MDYDAQLHKLETAIRGAAKRFGDFLVGGEPENEEIPIWFEGYLDHQTDSYGEDVEATDGSRDVPIWFEGFLDHQTDSYDPL